MAARDELDTQLNGNHMLQRWRACFPTARAVNFGYCGEGAGATCGLLRVWYMRQQTPRCTAWALRRIRPGGAAITLDRDGGDRHNGVGCCSYQHHIPAQASASCTLLTCYSADLLSDEVIAALAGTILDLDISCEDSKTLQLGDGAFKHLKGIQRLDMAALCDSTLTDPACAHLRGIQDLNISACGHFDIANAAFGNLAGIRKLNMDSWCDLDDAEELSMFGCTQFTDAALASSDALAHNSLTLASPN